MEIKRGRKVMLGFLAVFALKASVVVSGYLSTGYSQACRRRVLVACFSSLEAVPTAGCRNVMARTHLCL